MNMEVGPKGLKLITTLKLLILSRDDLATESSYCGSLHLSLHKENHTSGQYIRPETKAFSFLIDFLAGLEGGPEFEL